MKKLVLWTVILVPLILGIAWFATDPEVQRKVEDERQAKRQAAAQEAARKQKDWADGWKKWTEDAKRKTDERVKQANEPGFDDGFRMGFMGGKLLRSKTNIAAPAARINELALQEVQRQNVQADLHSAFVRGYNAGWSFGWTDKKK